MTTVFPVLRGDPITLRFSNLAIGGELISDLEGMTSSAHVRTRVGDVLVVEWDITIDGDTLVLTLDSDATALLTEKYYVFDIRFFDVENDGVATWPGPGKPRAKLVVSGPVTLPEV